jgi:uncharacterized membrane protein YgcG
MLGRLAPWRHGVVLVAVAACSILAFSGIIGGGNRSERFEGKQVVVQPAGANGVRIREVVDQDFGSHDRHGYERIIPNDFGVPIDVTASSPDAPADVSVVDEGANTRIRIGDPRRTLSGQHRYVLEYTLPDARLGGGELALDIIGNDETLETGRFDVYVTGLRLDDPTCNVGKRGATGGCTLEPGEGGYHAALGTLHPGDGITIGGRIAGRADPRSPADPPLPKRRNENHAPLGVAMIPLGLASAAGVYFVSRRLGRNEVFAGGAADAAFGDLPPPSPKGAANAVPTTLVADERMEELTTIEFVPPKGIEPWQGSVLLTERIDDGTIAAWFSGLVAREAITLEKDGDGDLVLGSGPRRAELERSEAAHIDQILDGDETFTLGTYDRGFARAWSDIRHDEDASIASSGWWKRLPPKYGRSSGGLSAGVMVVIVLFVFFGIGSLITAFLGALTTLPLAIAFGLVVPAVAAYAVYRTLLPARTAAGSALALRTESFRRFLVDSEGQHVEWAWKNGLLREYSAWAVALGAADAWGRALENSNVPPQAMGISSPLLIYSMAPSFAGSHTAPPSSGGGGGFGGGFSGGSVGGGGGGGSSGSW